MATAKVNEVTGLVDMELDHEQQEAMHYQCVLQCQFLQHQPSVHDVTANSSGEEFDWGFVDSEDSGEETDKINDIDEMDIDSDCSGLKPSADVTKQTKVSTTFNLFK